MEREIIIVNNEKASEPCFGCIYKGENGLCTNANCEAVSGNGEVYAYASKMQSFVKRVVKKAKEIMTANNLGKPSDTQVGGDHYKKYAIQPVEFIHKNNIGYMEGNVIKYVVRHRDKNGIEDLKKAKHYIEMLIQFEESEI